jgi:ankyrin repeat protein
VDYLCSHCDVNIEKVGSFKLPQNNCSGNVDSTIHFVTSFWVACVKGHLNLVKLLHQKYNADINSRSDSCSTALRSACYMSNYEVCKYLVENSANVNEPNLMGGTPLINSIQSLDLVKLLIEYNVDVNYQDFTGTTALHYAIQEYQHAPPGSSGHSLDVIQSLIRSGANPRLKNMYNEDAYRLASVKGDKQVLMYLIENTQPSIDIIVENLRLIGSYCADYLDHMNNAVLLWQRAIRLQCMSTTSASANDIEMFNRNDEEFYNNINDKYVIGLRANSDRNATDQNLCRYSCSIKSITLGKYHRETLFSIMKRGAYFADSNKYKLSIEYWNYGLSLTIAYKFDEKQKLLNKSISDIILINEYEFYLHESIFIINSLVSLYIEIYLKKKQNVENTIDENNNEIITIEHLTKLFNAIETQILDLMSYVHDIPINIQCSNSFHQLLCLLLNCVNLIINFDYKDRLEEKQKIFERIYKFLRKNSKNLNSKFKLNSQLIHLCVRKTTTNKSLLLTTTNVNDLSARFDLLAKYSFPNLTMIKFILNLNCGYHLNMKNDENETPLFVLMKKYSKSVEYYADFEENVKRKFVKFEFEITQDLINYMINNGAHIDLYDSQSKLLSNLFVENEFYVNQLKYVKLACLCANVIKKYRIKFNLHDLPAELNHFIEIH